MTRKTIVITRADLYAQVWAEPTRGYWARKQAGHAVRVEPLPAPIRGQEMEHRFERWMTPEAEYLLRDEFQAEIKDALTKADGVERNEALQGAHGLVAESLPLLQSASCGQRARRRRCSRLRFGALWPRGHSIPSDCGTRRDGSVLGGPRPSWKSHSTRRASDLLARRSRIRFAAHEM